MHEAITLPSKASRERSGVGRLAKTAEPSDETLGDQRPPSSTPSTARPSRIEPVRVDPDEAQWRQERTASAGRSAPWSRPAAPAGARPTRSRGPCRPRRCRRWRRRGAGRWPPPVPPGAERTGVGRADHQAEPAQDDGVEAVGGVAESPEQLRQGDLGPPLVRHPPAVRLGVAERVQAHEGVMGHHPLAGRQRPELVVGEAAGPRHRRDESDPENDPDGLDRAAAAPGAAARIRAVRCPRAGAAPAVGTSKVSTTRALACTAPPSYRSPTGIPACTVQRTPTGRRGGMVAIEWLRSAARLQRERLQQGWPLVDDAAHPRPEARRGHPDLEHLP